MVAAAAMHALKIAIKAMAEIFWRGIPWWPVLPLPLSPFLMELAKNNNVISRKETRANYFFGGALPLPPSPSPHNVCCPLARGLGCFYFLRVRILSQLPNLCRPLHYCHRLHASFPARPLMLLPKRCVFPTWAV